MFGFLRRLGGPVRYEQPYREPSRDELTLAELFPPVPAAVTRQLAELDDAIERRVRLYDQAIRELCDEGAPGEVVDTLLDARNAIRPPKPAQVPVIPGRSS